MDANLAVGLDELCPRCVYVREEHVRVWHCKRCRWRLSTSERICPQTNGHERVRWSVIAALGDEADRLARFNPVATFAWLITARGFGEAHIRKFVRVVGTCVVAWLDRVGWLPRTPKLVACRLTEIVLKRDFIEGRREDLRANCDLIAREFDATWLQLKQAATDSRTSVGMRVSKRRRTNAPSGDSE